MNRIQIGALLVILGGAVTLTAVADHHGDKQHRGKHGMMPPIEEVDTNADGNITLDELQAHKALRFQSADTNGDGVVSSTEFEAAADARKAEREAKRRDRAFKAMDANADGTITADEHAAFRAERMQARFDRVDENGDGMISEAEREAAKAKRKGKRGHGNRPAPDAE